MMKYALRGILFVLALVALNPGSVWAQQHANPCPRPENGSMVSPPPDLYSRNGVLDVSFNYEMGMDDSGRTLFCFVTPDGLESPTLHLNPGDRLNVTLTNANPPPPPGAPTERVSNSSDRCGDALMTITSVNLHFHGTNTSPVCHADEVIHTIVNSHETFQYHVKFPANEPSGLYWYHPHVHGIAEAAVQGGGSGAIVIEGIEKLQPAVAGLPERILLIRDLVVRGNQNDPDVPAWDVSLNYVTIPFPGYRPAMIRMRPGAKEFWRVANASADTIIDLRLRYDGATQPLQVVALDGVPTGSQDGTRRGKIVTEDYIRLPPAARAEFIMTGPAATVADAVFETLKIDTGPDGDDDPTRPLAKIETSDAPTALPKMPAPSSPPPPQMFEGLAKAKATSERKLYFSEKLLDPKNPAGPTNFFITVDGAKPVLFNPLNPPAIVTTQGAIEDWTIENRAQENHEFHLHQIHFLLLERDGVPVPASQQQLLDMVEVPYGTGKSPYPSVKVRMDFRGMDIGDFVYHCHILGHEDAGMMAIIQVLPPKKS
jgi:FtsP/CotA-like multicopper oxidase with cupredoxin domain